MKTYLDDDYNDYAKDLADLQKGINTVKKKLLEFQKEAKINVNRLTIYVKNQFYENYKFQDALILFRRDNKIEFQLVEDVNLAKKKYEELKESSDDTWLLDELEMVESNGILVTIESAPSNNIDSILEPFYQTYDNIKQYLPKPIKECDITAKQKSQLKELLFNCDNPKYQFLLDKLESLQSQYLETVDEVLDMINTSEYDFDIETDELITVRNDKDMTWHLVIETNEGYE